MIFLPTSSESIKQAAEILRNGGLVAFPTETVYGLGADAFNSQALAKVFEAKNRPHFNPLIIHIASIDTLEKVADLSLLSEERRQKLFLITDKLWPGPLSLILPKNEKIPGIATAGLPTAAIRFCDHDAAQKLISLSTGAVAAPSANPFGSLSPTRAEHVRDKLGEKVDMILDGGPARIGIESTVLDITSETIKILRPGGTPKEAIEKLIGHVTDSSITAESAVPKIISPGQLKSHYAPRTPLILCRRGELDSLPDVPGEGRLYFSSPEGNLGLQPRRQVPEGSAALDRTRVLSKTGDMTEAAANLFDMLHQ